jgi:hypothetical protein
MKFQLTLEWKSSKPIVVSKSFNTNHHKRGWSLARKWRNNCVQICGKNELGEICNSTLLDRIPS